jgi:hypothetical protein
MGMKHEPIAEVWAASCKLRAEGSKRYAEADMLTPECDELNAKGSALYARARNTAIKPSSTGQQERSRYDHT